MDSNTLYGKAFGCLAGLAIGDAMGRPAEGKTIEYIRQTYGTIEGFVSDDVSGTDDTEYAMLCAHTLIEGRGIISYESVTRQWLDHLCTQEPLPRGGESEVWAIQNLLRGMVAPISGSDNTRSYSDGAAMRIAPVGIVCAGKPYRAARLAAVESAVSHAGDGIYCAQAIAAGVAAAMVGARVDEIIHTALEVLPVDCWSRRWIVRGLSIAQRYNSPLAAAEALHQELMTGYAATAPEAVAQALAVFKLAEGDPRQAIVASCNVGRDADTIAAMAGALAGALHGVEALPADWVDKTRKVKGVRLRFTTGWDIGDVARQLVELIP